MIYSVYGKICVRYEKEIVGFESMKQVAEFLLRADDSDIGIVVVNTDLKVTHANAKGKSLYGLSEDSGFPSHTKVGQMIRTGQLQPKKTAGIPVEETVGGQSVHLLLYMYPFYKGEKIDFFLVVLCDNTLFQQHCESRYQQETTALVGEMAAGTANVILNPLAVIQGMLQLIEHAVKTNCTLTGPAFQIKINQFFQTLYDQVKEIDVVLQRFLLFKPSDIHFIPIDWTPFLHVVISRFQLKTQEKNIRLVCEYPRIPVRVFGSDLYLQEACYAILLNAFEVTPDNGKILIQMDVAELFFLRSLITEQGFRKTFFPM